MFYKSDKSISKVVSFVAILMTVCLVFTHKTYAASMLLVPDTHTVSVNNIISVKVLINTENKSINNMDANIQFPLDLLEVVSVIKNSSIFTLWVEEPSFSTPPDSITFNGGLPTPGYNGQSGYVATINFKAKKQGTASIIFTDGAIRENDGMGTDVTSDKKGTTIIILPYKGAITTEEIIASDKLPPSPIITSIEMSDPEMWYSLNKATFSWNLPEKVTAVQILFDHSPESTPTIIYNTPIKEKGITDLGDGVHYLHVRFKNSAGWGKTTHRKIKMDTTPPIILNVASSITKDELISLKINSKDLTSGVNKYKISVDGVSILETIAKDGNSEINLPHMNSGNHEISVIVYDKTGNLSEKIFTTKFPKIKAPEITKYTESIIKGQKIEISGTSYPNTNVRIWLQLENNDLKSYIIKTLDDKTFSFTSDSIDKTGLTSFWVEVLRTNTNDAISPSSDKYFVVVNKTPFVKISLATIEILTYVIPIFLLIVLLIYLIIHAYHRLKKMRRKLIVDLEQTESESHKIFKILKEDAKHSLKIIEENELNKKLLDNENKILNKLSKDIEEAEEYFTKRIESIEKKDL